MKKLLLFISLATLLSCSNSTPDKSDVKDAARAAILHHLKDMNSAKFHHNEIVSDIGNNTYTYTETVNATNSFGGSVAQNVVVKLKWNGGDTSDVSSYSLLDLQFNER